MGFVRFVVAVAVAAAVAAAAAVVVVDGTVVAGDGRIFALRQVSLPVAPKSDR